MDRDGIFSKLPRTTSARKSYSKVGSKKLGLERGRGKKIRYGLGKRKRKEGQVQSSMKKHLRGSRSHVHRGNATIWLNHRMMRAAMKKKIMVLPEPK